MTTRHCSSYLFLYSSQLSSNICFDEVAKKTCVTHSGRASDDKIDSLLYGKSNGISSPRRLSAAFSRCHKTIAIMKTYVCTSLFDRGFAAGQRSGEQSGLTVSSKSAVNTLKCARGLVGRHVDM